MAKQQDRVELKGSARAAMPGAQDAGPTDPNQQIEVTIFLRRGSKPAEFPSAAQMGASLPRERKYLTREQFAQLHGASASDIEKIRAFAAQYNLQVVSEDRASRIVKLSGTVQSFNAAFGVDLRRYEHSSGSYRCRTGALTIPADLESIIEESSASTIAPKLKLIFGCARTNRRSAHARQTSLILHCRSPRPTRFPANATGAGQCIGIIELGGGYNAADLDSFFSNLGISTPKVTAVSVDGAANSPTGDSSGPDGEVELDIEVAGAIAPAAQIATYFAPNTDQGSSTPSRLLCMTQNSIPRSSR